MKIFTHFSAERLTNIFVVADNDGNGIIVDPSHIDNELLEIIGSRCKHLSAVLITHRHRSHTEGIGTLGKIYSFDVYSASSEIEGLKSKELHDGDRFRIGGLSVEAIRVPGHSMDSLCYRIGSAVFTGDTLMAGTIGSTPTLLGKELLLKSIEEKLMCLEGSSMIYPGHGALSTIFSESMFNQDLLEYRASLKLFDDSQEPQRKL